MLYEYLYQLLNLSTLLLELRLGKLIKYKIIKKEILQISSTIVLARLL